MNRPAGRGADAAAALRARLPGVEVLRVVMPDLHGVLHGKAVPVARLDALLADGLGAPATLLLKDSAGRTAFPVWSAGGAPMQGAGDLRLRPDPDAVWPVPGAAEAWMLCDATRPGGDPIAFAPRTVLARALDRLAGAGLAMRVGLELEFHVFARRDDGGLAAMHPGGQLLSDAAYGACRALMDALRRGCDAAGLPLSSLEVEMGASQFEAVFEAGAPMEQADRAAIFRQMAREAAAALDLHATFMCRPPAPATMSSGWHLHQSIARDGRGVTDGAEGRAWIAGLLDHAAGACLLTNPTVNAYRRFAPGALAPDRVAWAHDNRGAMLRVLGSGPAARLENRVAEPGACPWLALAAQIHAGLDGVARGATPPEAVETPYDADAPRLPASLGEAIAAFRADPLWPGALGDETAHVLATVAEAAWRRYLGDVGEWDRREYLDLI